MLTRRRAAIAGGILLSLALLWWALRDVSPAELWAELRAADPWLMTAAVAVATGTFVLRAFRWRVLLLPALPDSSFRSRFGAVCVGFMGNNLLPLRLGEFARVYTFSRIEPLGMSATFASLVLERLFDGLMLVLLLVVALASSGLADAGPAVVRQGSAVAAVVVAAGLLGLWVVSRFPDPLRRAVRRHVLRHLPERLAHRLAGTLSSFAHGLGPLRQPTVFLRVLWWSAVIWFWNGASFWLAFLAFDIEAGFAGALLLQSVVALAVSLPSGPGFFGPFEAAARVSLTIYAVEPARIAGYAAGYHLLTFIPITVLGLWYAHRLGISWSEVEHSEEYVEAAVERAGEEEETSEEPGGKESTARVSAAEDPDGG